MRRLQLLMLGGRCSWHYFHQVQPETIYSQVWMFVKKMTSLAPNKCLKASLASAWNASCLQFTWGRRLTSINSTLSQSIGLSGSWIQKGEADNSLHFPNAWPIPKIDSKAHKKTTSWESYGEARQLGHHQGWELLDHQWRAQHGS